MKIYTKTGDGGQTGLFSGRRVSKADPRVEAYGTVDELNACLGLLLAHLPELAEDVRDQLALQQQHLFAVGAALADDRSGESYSVPEQATPDLENWMDEMDRHLPRMTHFILPSGSRAIAYAHLCRTVCRRAERRTVEVEGATAATISYLNRLSDYLFVLTRYLGHLEGVPEVKWIS
jgi:cob(I)alamin adenosyltransferase